MCKWKACEEVHRIPWEITKVKERDGACTSPSICPDIVEEGNKPGQIGSILKKIGIKYDAWPITKVIIENDLKMKKVFLRLK